MFVHEPITARHNRYGFGDSRIADSVSQTAMRRFLTTTRADLARAFTQGQGSSPLTPDPGWGMFEPARQVESIPPWVYWAGAGTVIVLVGAVVYKKRKGR